MLNDTTKLVTVNFDENTIATHEVVAAASGETITVHEVYLVSAGTTDIDFRSAATVKVGPFGWAAGDGIDVPAGGVVPFLRCVKGEAFQIALGSAIRVTGFIRYIQE
ncbi:hypothetical protein CMI37_31675 [Candidatus Pacearchaeota archaeon]|nr:hypothetical protein [Candidatus Pacearchaeota archaeon]|tara:strand:- start:2158 stop:2478 length:321 start_codon:yes stop_codon:yes gene_type:complete